MEYEAGKTIRRGCTQQVAAKIRNKTEDLYKVPKLAVSCSSSATQGTNNSNNDSSYNTCNSIRLNANNNRKIRTQRSLPLLLIPMTIVILMDMTGSSAASLSSSLSSESKSEASAISLELAHMHHGSGSLSRARLRKRQSRYVYFHEHMEESSMEWSNPCNGVYQPQVELPNQRSINRFAEIRKQASFEMNLIREELKTIDIDNMGMWKTHEDKYTFLPRLKPNSKVVLKRWYRQAQIYAASFAYLGRTEYKWDITKQMYASKTTHELSNLLLSARRILCEIETAINGTDPQHKKEKLTSYSRAEMDKKLMYFRTRSHDDSIDLKFAKHYYHEFVSTITSVLLKKQEQQDLSSAGSEDRSSSMGNTSASISRNSSKKRRQRINKHKKLGQQSSRKNLVMH